MINVLLVDDHDLVRAGLQSILDESDDVEVVAGVGTGEAAVDWVRHNPPPDVVLMDINMPGIGGIEATRKIRRIDENIQVIAVTALSDNPFPSQLLDAGALGYLTKGCPADEMLQAIRLVSQGRHYVANDVARKLTLSNLTKNGDADTPFGTLSQREMQVMLMITQGRSNQEISDSLFLSPKTISTYRHRLYEKLDVTNDVELTHMALRFGVIDQL